MKNIRLSKLDYKYLDFQIKDSVGEIFTNELFEPFKIYFILNVISGDQRIDTEARNIIKSNMFKIGNELKNIILEKFLQWHNRHTSPEHLMGFDEDEFELTIGSSFVEDGYSTWTRKGEKITIDIRPLVYKVISKVGREEGWSKNEIRELVAYAQDDPNTLWKELLSEENKIKVLKVLAPYIFKEWKKIWGEDLIKPTKDVLKAIERLQAASPEELPGAITLALNVSHVHGLMAEHLDLSEGEMHILSNIPQKDIDDYKSKIFQPDYSEGETNFSLTANKENKMIISTRELNKESQYVLPERADKLKYSLMKQMGELRIRESWQEFKNTFFSELDEVIDKYAKSQTADIQSRINIIEEQWTAAEKNGTLTPEKQTAMSDQLAALDDEKTNKRNLVISSLKNMRNSMFIEYMDNLL